MPATTPNPAKNGKAAAAEYIKPDYVNIDLTNEQREDLVLLRDSITDSALLDYVFTRVTGDHIYSLKPAEQGWIASMTGKGPQSGHANQCLTARGSTARNAAIALLYKDRVVCADKPWPTKSANFDL